MAMMYEVLGEKKSLDFEAIEKANAATRKKKKQPSMALSPVASPEGLQMLK